MSLNKLEKSRCLICGGEHVRRYANRPALYCLTCSTLKRISIGEATHVLCQLYLGDRLAAARFEGSRLCVSEDPPDYVGEFYHVPLLARAPNSTLDRSGAIVSLAGLEAIVGMISDHMLRQAPLIVHCVGGVERSPLAVAWYLWVTAAYPSLETAYEYLKRIRPVVVDRRQWIPEAARRRY